MKLAALTAPLLRQAVAVYQAVAYGVDRPVRPGQDPLQGLPADAVGDVVLRAFQREAGPTSGPAAGGCQRFLLRLGNRNYPFMKLVFQEHLVPGEFYFGVDTHDQLEIQPNFPDYEQWLAVRRFNRDLKVQIEQALTAAGFDTAAVMRRRVLEQSGRGPAAGEHGAAPPCRGLCLIVDDEEDLACAVEALLQRAGFRTWKVYDGRAGLLAAQELQPDLLLLDYELPELDGLQVLAQLRADPATSHIPVLLNSAARVSAADRQHADAFLCKPFPEAMLHEAIDRVLARREGRR
ncbi:MAG: response regulator [Planctomycetes bacterium]|nr:response regulator [Planctomycetota bacterium]